MFSSITAKRKKLILLILIVLGVSAILIFTALSQKGASATDDSTIIMSNSAKNSTDKVLAQQVQLQERLQKTINALDEVETSTVTITPSDNNIAPTASVVIKLANGKTLTTEQQAEIKKLVHGSKNDILDENITLSIS